MERPASRGLLAAGVAKAPTGVQMERPERPSTASRQPSAGPPSTAASSRSLGSALRSNQAPPSTAYKRVTATGVSTQQSVEAQVRPLTQQGMGGAGPATQATGRQVLDRTYFVNELKQKRQQIINVNAQMRVRSVCQQGRVHTTNLVAVPPLASKLLLLMYQDWFPKRQHQSGS